MLAANLVKKVRDSLLCYLLQHPEIKQAILFGSQATGREYFESDVDLAIELEYILDAIKKKI
ncbi:MAG: nucleotidyltransferase domain-containing protein [Mariprofundaceae bacterium]|nr:nucleotidyltransferase domain-containing protein [Mariprofundaceae bacterium]